MKHHSKSRFGYGILFIEIVMVSFCAIFLVLAYRYDSVKQEKQLSADTNILRMSSDRIESLFTRIDMLTDMVCDPSNDYAKKLQVLTGNRVDDFKTYNQVKNRFESETSIIFTDTVRRYTAVWLMDDSLEITGLFAFPKPFENKKIFQPKITDRVCFGKLSDYAYIESFLSDGNPVGTYYLTMPEYPNVVYIVKRCQISMSESSDRFKIRKYNLGLMIFGIDLSDMFVSQWDETDKPIEYMLKGDHGAVLATNCTETIDDELILNEGVSKNNGRLVYTDKISKGLTLYTMYPLDGSVRGNWVYLLIFTIVSIILVILGLLIATYISRFFLRPIAALSGWIADYGQELVPDSMFKHYHPDIKRLVFRYNEHIGRIKELIEHIQEQQQREYDVEMRLMQTQINPHFIYNTFDAICYRELLKGEDEIAGILNDVSTIMRYGLKQPNTLVPFKSEMEMLEHYIAIERVCYDVPIRFTVDLDKRCGDVLVPKMILQPLVENALLYARQATDREIGLKLLGNIEGNTVCIKLEDSGTGVNVDELNRNLSDSQEMLLERNKGIGTLNVHLRIHRRFGPEYGLRYCKNENGNTVVEIRLPVTR